MNDRSRLAQFHIAFDTNFAYNGAENKLIKDDLSALVLETSKIKHAQVSWYLLDIVQAERQYQMLQVADALVAPAKKVGRLLGQDFGITPARLEQGVQSVIADEVKRHKLTHINLNTHKVDWKALIDRSLSRKPPFEKGKTEKGFRDALVMETFFQLVQKLSGVKGHLRVIFLTADKLLIDAVRERAAGKDYVIVADELNFVTTTLNAFVSNIGEHEIELILEFARELFYNPAGEGLFIDWNIPVKITAQFDAVLSERPSSPPAPNGAVTVSSANGVGPTAFLGRTDKRLNFSTDVDVDVFFTERIPMPTGSIGTIFDAQLGRYHTYPGRPDLSSSFSSGDFLASPGHAPRETSSL